MRVIAAKYKEYDRLRRKPTAVQLTPSKGESLPAKNDINGVLQERPANSICATPKKTLKETKSLQGPISSAEIDQEPTPACIRTALGPTPQKDGAALSIFDMLPAATPSKGVTALTSTAEAIVSATPSKTAASSSNPEHSKTPQSSSKRFFLDAFAGTPLKRKREDGGYTPRTTKRQYATPSFLRRNFPLARIDEDSHETAAAQPPFKRRGIVRSLSTIIQGLKKQEEKRMDEDWEILEELESEERGEKVLPKVAKVLVEDSQAAEMPLGPDKGVDSEDEASDKDNTALDANGKPRKAWKKKGLKRQTKRVKMRPILHRPKKAADSAVLDIDTLEDVEGEPGIVEESQPPQRKQAHSGQDDSDNDDPEIAGDLEGSEYEQDDQQSDQEGAKKSSKKRKAKQKDAIEAERDTNSNAQAKKGRKVNPQAHANFRKLKIKNKNTKANGRGRKFGRR